MSRSCPAATRASDALSRDTLRWKLRDYAKRALDCALPAPGNGHTHEEPSRGGGRETTAPLLFEADAPRMVAVLERSVAWQLLESLPDQLVKLLRLRGERLHLVLSELRLKRQNFLKILCLGDLFDQRES